MSTPLAPASRLRMVLTGTVLNDVLGTVAVFGTADEPLPVESSRTGSIFTDRFDPRLRWYLPEYTLPSADAAFAFAATEQGVDTSTGQPFDVATITLTIAVGEPADVTAGRAADASLMFHQILLDPVQFTLTFTGKDHTGADQPIVTPLTTTMQPDGTLTATATLVGPAVVVAYESLAHGSDATVQVTGSYSVWRAWQPFLRVPLGPVRATFLPAGAAVESSSSATAPAAQPLVIAAEQPVAMQLALQPGTPASAVLHDWTTATFHLPTEAVKTTAFETGTFNTGTFEPQNLPVTWVTAADQEAQTRTVGSSFGTDAYRARYTITAGDITRPIIDAGDLTSFAQQRSEFRELTSLGDVSSRYPSLRRLYFGQVSGAVLVVPQSYGIVRGSTGLAALLEAVADDSSTAASGCRFEFTFTLAPLVDPIDLAQLAHDLRDTPEAASAALHIAVPDSLDPRFPSTFTGFSASTSTVTDGPRPGTVQVRVTITDEGQTPAISSANLFLHQFASAVSPMTGAVTLRLDDVYPTAVMTSFVLSLTQTASSDELSLSATAEDLTKVTVQNVGQFDLILDRAASLTDSGPSTAVLNTSLAASESATLDPQGGAPISIVRSRLALADPLPRGAIFDYLVVHTETVSQVQHSLIYSASLDFAAEAVAQLDIAATLTDLPSGPIPTVTLTPTHTSDSVHALVPIDVLVTGLTAHVEVTVTATDGTKRTVDIDNDFLQDPMLTITSASLRAQPA